MNPLFATAEQVQRFCDEADWRFCFIGGLAVQRWGEPRLTRDVDLTLLTGFGGEDLFVDRLLERFESRVDDPQDFARRTRVLLLRSEDGVPIDIALGALPFEERSVERSSAWDVAGSRPLRTCGVEDLVVYKVFAGRDRDWADVRGILARQGPTLNAELIIAELSPLLDLKEDELALPRLQDLLE